MLHALPGAAASTLRPKHTPRQTSPQVPASSSDAVSASALPQRAVQCGTAPPCRLVLPAAASKRDICWTNNPQKQQRRQQCTVLRSGEATSAATSTTATSSSAASNNALPVNGQYKWQPASSSGQACSQQPCTSREVDKGKRSGSSSSSSLRMSRGKALLSAGQQLSGAAIMQQLKAASSVQQLQELVEQHEANLNWRHSCALITHLAQLQQQQQHHPPTSAQVPQSLAEEQQCGFGALHSPTASSTQTPQTASDKAAFTGTPSQLLEQFVQAQVVPLINSHIQLYDARGLANCLWSIAKLHAAVQPSSRLLQELCSASEPMLQQFDAQQLSNTLWSLAQLQHTPSPAWMQSWHAAMLQACSPAVSSWHPQSVSRAAWSLAQLHLTNSSSNSQSVPSSFSILGYDQVMTAALQRIAAPAGPGHSRHALSSGQEVSNILWACVHLQQSPSQQMLLAMQSWLQHVVAHPRSDPRQQQQLSDQAVANCLWALGKLHQRQQQSLQHASPPTCVSSSSSKSGRIMRQCGRLLLQLSAAQLERFSDQHLTNWVWGAGALELRVQPSCSAAVLQRLQQRSSSLTDQQFSNLMWGLSRLKHPDHFRQRHGEQNPEVPSQQQQQDAQCIEQLLSGQVDQLQVFSSQAVGSTLLSLARMQHIPQEYLLHAWLGALTRRPLNSSQDRTAVVDACCALALMRQHQHAAASIRQGWSPDRPSWGNSTFVQQQQQQRSLRIQELCSRADKQWLQDFCTATMDGLDPFSADQLCSIAHCMTVLGFRAPVPWLAAWQAAVVERMSSMSAVLAARAISVQRRIPGIAALGATALHSAQSRLADAAVAAVCAADAEGRATAQDVAAAATCMVASYSSTRTPKMQQLLHMLPSVLSSCTMWHLRVVLSAAAAVQVPLQPSVLTAMLQNAMQQQHRSGHRTAATKMSLLVAVAKLLRCQQQEVSDNQTVTATDLAQRQQQQEVLLQWLQQVTAQLQLQRASPAELSAALWALAALRYHPGHSWLALWEQHSSSALHMMSPSQLASCGWALTAIRYRPAHAWLSSWSQCVVAAVSSVAVSPRSLALLLYSSATLACPVTASWLLAAGRSAARYSASWSAVDAADGLWGLGQLGLREVADEELLELLLDRLIEATGAAGQLQQLSAHRQLQVLQAAVLLGPGPEDMNHSAGHGQLWQVRMSPGKRKAKLRWLSFRAWRSTLAARQVAAAAAAAGSQRPVASSAANPSQAPTRQVLAATVGKAAVVSAKFSQLKTGRHPAASAASGVVQPSWFMYWCRCSVLTVDSWGPQQVAAALGAFASLELAPPLEWQQQMLTHVVTHCHMSVPTASAIQDALVALESPLATTWRGAQHFQYVPQQTGGDGQRKQQQQQSRQGRSLHAADAIRELRFPHHLRGNRMRQLCRKQRLMRTITWWREQQMMQQQYAQQQMQQLGEFATPSSAYPNSSSSSAYAGSSTSSSSALRSASRTEGSQSDPLGLPESTPRRLDSTAWGKQLQRPALRPPVSTAAAAAEASSHSSTPPLVDAGLPGNMDPTATADNFKEAVAAALSGALPPAVVTTAAAAEAAG